MSNLLEPDTVQEILEIVKWANANSLTLEIIGKNSKKFLGRPINTSHKLNLQKLSGIEDYLPNELVITAKAGTPISTIKNELAKNRQHLIFEPPNFSPLFGRPSNPGSIGGMISCNLAGPRRVVSGAVRDHFLGFKAISGRGEKFKSGGKVVKNVTGFDLSKLIAGSYGTLAIMTEVTLKALPSPEKTRTVLVKLPSVNCTHLESIKSMTNALTSSHEVSGAAFLPKKVSERSKVGFVKSAGCSLTVIRIEGPGPSVKYRCEALKKMLKDFGEIEELHSRNSIKLWREIRDVSLLKSKKNQTIWRISCPPAEGIKFTSKIFKKGQTEAMYDWGGGLIWLTIEKPSENQYSLIQSIVKQIGGHATLFFGSDRARLKHPVFQPLPTPLMNLTQRIKDGFDPNRILNPGRMYIGL